jgi:hypothetical protein
MFDIGAQPTVQRPTRVRVGEELVADSAQRFNFAHTDRDQQVAAVRKMAVKGGVTDPRTTCDLVQRDVRAMRSEELVRGDKKGLVVAAGIGPHWRMNKMV